MKIRSIKSTKDLKGKKVLLRVDFNVPLKKGKIIDDFRIKSGLPTIKYLLNKGAAVIILNHLGRPKGKVTAELSNKPVSQRLSKLLKKKVIQLDEVVGAKSSKTVKSLKLGQIVMLENVRFHHREEKNCKRLARTLASYADLFVNDAFAVCHRKASSVSAITEYLPSYAGLLLESEIENLSKVLESKVKPKVAIIGGAKLETKVKVITNLLKKMDYVLVGGAIANNFFKAKGYEVGKSLVDDEYVPVAKKLLKNKLIIPEDVAVAKKISAKSKSIVKPANQVNQSEIILDIGPKSVKKFTTIIKKSKMVVWNGPLGYFEIAKFKKASSQIAKAIAGSKTESIIGGGETVQLIEGLGLKNKFSFVSTGGGAMLEFLEGKMLPGIRPLVKR
ncbi:phosphoglycerate kinase [Patescibacteria group bacterium]|nr:phosphoglycerate kinase [Patescibacteria group bacterium]